MTASTGTVGFDLTGLLWRDEFARTLQTAATKDWLYLVAMRVPRPLGRG